MNSKTRAQIRARLYEQQKAVCFYCERKMPKPEWNNAHNMRHATLDHLIPLSKGGQNHSDNLVLACRSCNQLKADMMPRDFLEMIGMI